MQSRLSLGCTLVAGLLLAPLALGQAAADPKHAAAEVGQAAPSFTLKGADGKTYNLSDFKDKVVVLEWLNQDCPVSKGAQPVMKETSQKYAGKGVVWLAIDSTHGQTGEKDAEYAQKLGLSHPILLDSDGKVGHAYGAKTTPHMYVINKGTLVYAGAIDNNAGRNKSGDQYRNYVAEALDSVLAGKEIALSKTQPYGCSVKYGKS